MNTDVVLLYTLAGFLSFVSSNWLSIQEAHGHSRVNDVTNWRLDLRRIQVGGMPLNHRQMQWCTYLCIDTSISTLTAFLPWLVC